MNHRLHFHALAAARGDGLLPRLAAALERGPRLPGVQGSLLPPELPRDAGCDGMGRPLQRLDRRSDPVGRR